MQEHKAYTHHQERLSDEQIFSNAFQNVLQTGTNYETLLQLEYIFQSEIEDMLKQRDKQLQELNAKFVRTSSSGRLLTVVVVHLDITER